MSKLKDSPKHDRPREKFLEKGSDALTDSELLAILLGSGIKGTNVKLLAQKISRKFGNKLMDATVDDLKEISGIGNAKALQIASMFALARRMYNKHNGEEEHKVLSALDVAMLVPELKTAKREHLVCLYLNARSVLVHKEIVSVGTLDKSIIHPREVFAPGLEKHAASVIVVHNHPSGDPSPSDEDKQVAARIVEAGKIVGIDVLDFLIIAECGVHSILGELQKVEPKETDYVAEGNQGSLFDLLVDSRHMYFLGVNDKAPEPITKTKHRFIDLFAGIGGFHVAFHNAGAECVFVSEWDEPARATYRHNFYKVSPDVFRNGNFVGDITQVNEQEMPDFDIITGGFPCQPFSQAGFKKGFNEARGTLFFDVVRLMREKKPKAFFLENVRGLYAHDGGKTFETIKRIIEEDLGYSFHAKIVKASDFGMPQHRPRLFMVGFRDGHNFEWPESEKKLRYNMSDVWGGKCDKEIGFTLRVGGRGSSITDRRNWDSYRVNGKVVQLGPKQGLKMQGFPEWFEFPEDVSDVQSMKQLGNSVAVPAIQAVAERIIETLEKYDK
jgi:DNA (cytosine-5)-methyltransferase 1